jgi:hypothetical protein
MDPDWIEKVTDDGNYCAKNNGPDLVEKVTDDGHYCA